MFCGKVKKDARKTKTKPPSHHHAKPLDTTRLAHATQNENNTKQAAVVEGDLPRSSLKRGVEAVLARHPMLRACIRTPDGPKEPLINILGEEREDGDPLYFCESQCGSLGELAERVLAPEEAEVAGEDEFTREWRARLESNLDNARLPVSAGPNWRMETIRLAGGRGKKERGRTALVCTMNHALEDQRSSNLMLKGILEAAAGPAGKTGSGDENTPDVALPPSMEAAMVEGLQFRGNTLGYMWDQATVAIAQPKVLPDGLPPVEERVVEGEEGPFGVASRKSACEFSSLPEADVTAMLQACRCVWLTGEMRSNTWFGLFDAVLVGFVSLWRSCFGRTPVSNCRRNKCALRPLLLSCIIILPVLFFCEQPHE